MATILQKTLPVRDALLGIVGITQAKTVFSYYGIFKDDVLIGLCKNNQCYLRMPKNISDDDIAFINELSRLNDPRMGIHCKNYYHFSPNLLAQANRYSHLILATISELKQQKEQLKQKQKTQLRALPNLNINSERLLKKLGIYSINDFLNKGAYSTYVELIKLGFDVDKNFLFKLYGAIERQYTYTMTDKQKSQILKEADQALYDAGLRKRFKGEYE